MARGRGGRRRRLWTVAHAVAEVKRAAARPVNGETPANKVLSTPVGGADTWCCWSLDTGVAAVLFCESIRKAAWCICHRDLARIKSWSWPLTPGNPQMVLIINDDADLQWNSYWSRDSLTRCNKKGSLSVKKKKSNLIEKDQCQYETL